MPRGGVDERQLGGSRRIARKHAQCLVDIVLRYRYVAKQELELRKLDERPCRRLRISACRLECKLHRGACAREIAAQLPCIGNPRVGGEARPNRRHAIESRERRPVATELDESVAHDAVGSSRPWEQALRASPVGECGSKLMPNE